MPVLGLLLVVVGAALAAGEAHVPTHGALGVAGTVSLAAGLAILVSAAGLGAGAVVAAALAATLFGLAFAALLARKALGTRRIAISSGVEGLVGRLGEVRTAPAPVGRVLVDGALWRARVWELEDGRALAPGDPVVVERVSGLTLTVRPAEEWEVAP